MLAAPLGTAGVSGVGAVLTPSGDTMAVGSREAGAGAADGDASVRRTTQTRTNFWRRLLRLASAV